MEPMSVTTPSAWPAPAPLGAACPDRWRWTGTRPAEKWPPLGRRARFAGAECRRSRSRSRPARVGIPLCDRRLKNPGNVRSPCPSYPWYETGGPRPDPPPLDSRTIPPPAETDRTTSRKRAYLSTSPPSKTAQFGQSSKRQGLAKCGGCLISFLLKLKRWRGQVNHSQAQTNLQNLVYYSAGFP